MDAGGSAELCSRQSPVCNASEYAGELQRCFGDASEKCRVRYAGSYSDNLLLHTHHNYYKGMHVATITVPPNVLKLTSDEDSSLPWCNKPPGSKPSSSSSTAAPLAGAAWPYPAPSNFFSMQMQPSMQPAPNIGGNAPGSSVSRPHSLHACLEFTLCPTSASYLSFLQLPVHMYSIWLLICSWRHSTMRSHPPKPNFCFDIMTNLRSMDFVQWMTCWKQSSSHPRISEVSLCQLCTLAHLCASWDVPKKKLNMHGMPSSPEITCNYPSSLSFPTYIWLPPYLQSSYTHWNLFSCCESSPIHHHARLQH